MMCSTPSIHSSENMQHKYIWTNTNPVSHCLQMTSHLFEVRLGCWILFLGELDAFEIAAYIVRVILNLHITMGASN